MSRSKYTCPKCGGRNYESGQARVTGGFWSKIFNIQNRKFLTLACNKCGYTEFYNQKKSGTAENILDLITN